MDGGVTCTESITAASHRTGRWLVQYIKINCSIKIVRLKSNWLIKQGQINILKPTGYVMHQQFNIQQLYVLPTLYLCVLYLSENTQRLVPLTA